MSSSADREGPPLGGGKQQQENLPVRTVRIPHTSSYDVSDGQKKESYYPPQQLQQQGYNDYHHTAYGTPTNHQTYQGYPSSTRHVPPRVRQVVTDGSFGNSSGNSPGNSRSFEEERDDFSGRARDPRYASHGNNNQGYYRHQGSPPAESRFAEDRQDMREGSEQARDQAYHASPQGGYVMVNPSMVPPSPSSKRSIDEMTSQDSSDMSTSAPTFQPPSDNLKRSYYHHSVPGDRGSSLPPDFIPPKKSKIGKSPPRHEKVLTPRRSGASQGYFNRTHSWSSQDGAGYGPPHQQVRKTNSFPDSAAWNDGRMEQSQGYYGGHQGGQPDYNPPQDQRSPQSAFRGVTSPRSSSQGHQPYYPSFSPPENANWHGSHETNWAQTAASPRNEPGSSPSWGGIMGRHSQQKQRDDTPARTPYRDGHTPTESEMRRQVTFESGSGEVDGYHRRTYSHGNQGHPHYPPPASPSARKQKSSHTTESSQKHRFHNTLPPVMESRQEGQPVRADGSSILLLAQPEDRISLSETLCVIRENIEVFVATAHDVEAPAPGRKHPVSIGQLGLRCIHCAHAEKHSDKIKRATCYPSSIKRIYRTVIDMKLDHFHHCPFVPLSLKERLEALKATNTRSTGTTMQYFVRSAQRMGMVDTNAGVRLVLPEPEPEVMQQKESMESMSFPEPMKESSPEASPVNPPPAAAFEEREPTSSGSFSDSRGARSPESREQLISHDPSLSLSEQSSMEMEVQPIDSNEEIPEFTGIALLALPEDVMSLSPLRCFLRQNVCAFTATEEDIAVRTPTTFAVVPGQVGIGCIHCRKLPAKERSNRAVCFPFSVGRIYQAVADIQRFHFNECKMVPQEVRETFVKLQSKSSKGSKGLATRQYWVSSAKKIGLVDTSKGIRFGRDPSVPEAPAVSLDILAQVASNVTTVNRPLVVPEDRGTIAEFLYVVMGQLQPCRFTEADRNKRRVKNMGCIGVECKHCAGQVESRKFFWSSVNAVESNFVSVHTHMLECRHVPEELKNHIRELKNIRKEQTQNLKIGSQKAFFARVWDRLHTDDTAESPAEAAAAPTAETADAQSPQSTNVDTVRDKMAVVSV